jgi:hypothetical protein
MKHQMCAGHHGFGRVLKYYPRPPDEIIPQRLLMNWTYPYTKSRLPWYWTCSALLVGDFYILFHRRPHFRLLVPSVHITVLRPFDYRPLRMIDSHDSSSCKYDSSSCRWRNVCLRSSKVPVESWARIRGKLRRRNSFLLNMWVADWDCVIFQ